MYDLWTLATLLIIIIIIIIVIIVIIFIIVNEPKFERWKPQGNVCYAG